MLSPPAPQPPTSAPASTGRSLLGYLPALDGLRALAVAAVLAYHLGYSRVPGGYIGVEVFFVLSGWLVCALLAAEHRAQGGIDLKAFWLRRARRLLPAVSLVVGITLVAALQARYHHFATLRGDGLAALGYVLNWRLIIDQKSYFVAAATGPSPLQHLWSLSIEEQFYLVLPLLLGLTLAGRRTAPRAALLALVAAVVATAWRLAVDAPGGDPSRLYYGTDTRAAGLLVGAALALVWVPSRLRPVPGRWAGPVLDIVALASLGVLGWYTFEVGERDPDAFGWSLTVVQIASVTLIAVIVHPVRGLVARAMALRPLRWIGQRSYGIYLWHWPLIVLLAKAPGEQPESPARSATIVAATLVIAAASYRLVEQPIRQHGVADAISLTRRWTARHIAGRPVLTGAVTALAIVGYVGGVLLARDIVAADDTGTDTPPTALVTADHGDGNRGPGTAAGDQPDCEPGTAPAPLATTSAGNGGTGTAAIDTTGNGETSNGETSNGGAGTAGIDTTGNDETGSGETGYGGAGSAGVHADAANSGPTTPRAQPNTDAAATSAPSASAATSAPEQPGTDAGSGAEQPGAGAGGAAADMRGAGGSGSGTIEVPGTGAISGAELPSAGSGSGATEVPGAGSGATGVPGAGAGGGAGGRGCPDPGAGSSTPPAVAVPAGNTGVPAGPGAPGAPTQPALPAPAPAPTTPPPPPPAPLPLTSAIGDSVMLGAAPALQARFGPQLVLEATVGFQMVDAPDLVRRMADEGRLGDVVVLHLGANGPFPDETLDEIVATVGRRPLLLVNVKVPRRWEAEVNDRIAAAAERHPNVEVLDWRTVSESEDGLLWHDGHHLTPAGAERYADLIASYATAAAAEPEPPRRGRPLNR